MNDTIKKTVRGHLDTLPENVKRKVIVNIKRESGSQFDHVLNSEVSTPGQAILESFVWIRSFEGSGYWKNVYRSLGENQQS